MQKDVSAFEGWALIFKANLGEYIDIVTLNWNKYDEPTDKSKEEWRHFNRFLYRVDKFEKLYSDWFKAETQNNSWEKQVKNEGWSSLVLNKEGDRKLSEEEEKFSLDNEHEIEEYFKKNDKLKIELKKYGIEIDEVKNQFPIGIFNGKVEKSNYIFTGGKSAIDLYGMDEKNKSFNIFELKGYNNIKIGILSELFFYSSIIRDAIDGNIEFGEHKNIENYKLNAFFLVQVLHPLITENVIKLLNVSNKRIEYHVLKYAIEDIKFD
ncbi:hypothetical protein [Sedimentibacter sp. B4]|uniref:hypothetical protein n=1 Tax=Sedimentibacter sp. B4 TaxID=304766 RepID=UPI0002D6515E|nr:hypothetical protein [Sedimentibacter sp. B4]